MKKHIDKRFRLRRVFPSECESIFPLWMAKMFRSPLTPDDLKLAITPLEHVVIRTSIERSSSTSLSRLPLSNRKMNSDTNYNSPWKAWNFQLFVPRIWVHSGVRKSASKTLTGKLPVQCSAVFSQSNRRAAMASRSGLSTNPVRIGSHLEQTSKGLDTGRNSKSSPLHCSKTWQKALKF